MRQRCPSHIVIGPAVLHGYRLTFPRRGRNWAGGVAGIVRDEHAVVRGALYRLSPDDLRALDAMEGVAHDRYRRVDVIVRTSDGRELAAIAYEAVPEPGGPFEPHATYLNAMIAGARDHGIDEGVLLDAAQWLTVEDVDAS
jgi:gamma-glutamylcyclotransferase (GGCT)/AIG2-like uncharacterized protein YtfP